MNLSGNSIQFQTGDSNVQQAGIPDSLKEKDSFYDGGSSSNKNKGVKINMEEVGKHNKETDCWVVVNGEVLDVTNFMHERHQSHYRAEK